MAAYEGRRGLALGRGGAAPPGGLALLQRRGLAVWMQAWSPPPTGAATTPTPPSGPAVAPPLVVSMLAQMMWTLSREARG